MIVTSSNEAAQGGFAIVHRKTFAPVPRPVIPEVGLLGDVIVPEPLISVHVPVPAAAVLPASVAVLLTQKDWSLPALATVGTSDLVMVTSSKVAVHGEFAIVQRKTFAPTPRPVIPEVGLFGVVIAPVPLISVQVPIPAVAVLPPNVAVVAQTL